jgi:hypothetical protein
MKRTFIIILLLTLSLRAVSQPTTVQIGELINNRDYFKLKRELEKVDTNHINKISDFPLTIGDTCIIPSIENAASDELLYTNRFNVAIDGVIGQDIIMLYDKILIDIKNMSVRMIKE